MVQISDVNTRVKLAVWRTCEFEGLIRLSIHPRQRVALGTPIVWAEYPTPAARPAYSVLSNDRLASVFGVRLPGWEEALGACLAERSAER